MMHHTPTSSHWAAGTVERLVASAAAAALGGSSQSSSRHPPADVYLWFGATPAVPDPPPSACLPHACRMPAAARSSATSCARIRAATRWGGPAPDWRSLRGRLPLQLDAAHQLPSCQTLAVCSQACFSCPPARLPCPALPVCLPCHALPALPQVYSSPIIGNRILEYGTSATVAILQVGCPWWCTEWRGGAAAACWWGEGLGRAQAPAGPRLRQRCLPACLPARLPARLPAC